MSDVLRFIVITHARSTFRRLLTYFCKAPVIAPLTHSMKHLFRSFLLLTLAATPAVAAIHTRNVSAKDIVSGYVVAQFPAAEGAVSLSKAQYQEVDALPKGITADVPEHFTVITGVERGQRFMAVRIPAYSRRADGGYQMLTSFTLNVPDAPAAAHAMQSTRTAAAAKVAATTTPLSAGTWYKIALPARGVYKIDYAFLQSLGISGNISSANIRLVGNGGAMLYESNAVPRPLDLTENAIWVSDGGDGAFGGGDFFAFYAPGPVRWDKDSLNGRFVHTPHLYADSSYYFLSVDAGAGLRIADAPAVSNATTNVTSFDDYTAHEVDLYNPGKFGKEWWGEAFGSGADAQQSRDFSFPLGNTVDTVRVRMSAASRSFISGTQMNATLNGKTIGAKAFGAVPDADDADPVDPWYIEQPFVINAASANFHFTYSALQYDDVGYLNYIELNWRRPLAFAGGNFAFRDWRSVAPGAVAAYNLSGATSTTQVWDITNPLQPRRMSGSLSGNTFSFRQDASALHEFVALDGSNFLTASAVGKVDNQNLHGADAPQLVIVSHPDFLSAANRLADFHRQHDGMRVLVATTQQVYNEFSSGAQDIGGIRDMMRYYYLTAGTDTSRMPRYLLLFGDASYDYKNRTNSNTNFVPTYESNESLNAGNAYVVDDYYGFLDDNEDIGNVDTVNTLELGIGRIPVATITDADAAVNKILVYSSKVSLGPWRIANTYVGDNEDNAGTHLLDAEDANGVVSAELPYSNAFKIYLDNLTFVSTPGGERCPDANKGINDQIYKGTFLINYTGHGSTTTLAHERILTKEDFAQWKNINKLPIMVTATCDYARYDNPRQVSNGEGLIVKNDGGVIAMLTTTGPVYSNFNQEINRQYLEAQYTRYADGSWPTFGDAIRLGKNVTYKVAAGNGGRLINFYRFTLLGDPALQPAFPKHIVRTDTIKALGGAPTDSMRALGAYTLTGHVEDIKGTLLSNFNGRAYVTIYDKPRVVNLVTKETQVYHSYKMQDNIIFKGLTSVKNGRFACSFIAPKDMNYEYGRGKVSYYAEDSTTDGAGLDTGIVVGGFQDGADGDNDAPVVKPFIGDTLFRDGGLTGSNTLLYVQLSDHSGINVSGNSVGHDLTAVLDGNDANPFILNDYYQSEPNTYQRGHVSFPLTGLSEGAHTIKVKGWDVYNNSGEGTVHFVVGGGGFSIHDLKNYPNPFTTETHFFFEHNHPGEVLKAQIWIYNTSGQMLRLLEQSFTPSGSHSNELIWDGTDSHGALLPSGIYPYRLMLTTEKGISGTAYEKLVIIR